MTVTKDVFRRIEDLLALDKCKDAIALVNAELERDGPTPKLIFTLADVLSRQGYRGRAEKVLSEYLAKVDKTKLSPEDNMLLDLMNMQLAFLTPWNTAIFGPSLRSAIEIRAKYSSKLLESDWDSGNPVAIKMELYYFGAIVLADQYRCADISFLKDAVNIMRQLFKSLLQKKLHYEAAQVAWNVQVARKAGGDELLMREVLHHPECPELLQARLIRDFLTVKPPLVLENGSELEKRARFIFTKYGHATGTVELDLHHAYLQLKSGDGSPSVWKTIQDSCDALEALDAFSKLRLALGEFFEASNSTAHSKFFEVRHSSRLYMNTIVLKENEVVPWVLNSISLLMFWNLQSGHASKAMETAEAVYNELKRSGSDCEYLMGMAAQSMASCFGAHKNKEKTMHWAEICYDHWRGLTAEDKGTAEYVVLTSKLVVGGRPSAEEAVAIEQSTWDQIQEDQKAELWSIAVMKAESILSPLIVEHPELDREKWASLVDGLVEHLPEDQKAIKRANVKQLRGVWRISEAQKRKDTLKEKEALSLYEEAAPLYQSQGAHFAWANTQRMIGWCYFGIFEKTQGVESLRAAIEHFETAKRYFEEVNQLSGMIDCCSALAGLAFKACLKGWLDVVDVMRILDETEVLKDRMRDDLSTLNTLDAVSEKQKLRNDPRGELIYFYAITICLNGSFIDTLWEWVQRSKARSISDMLGLGALLPQQLLADLESDAVNGISALELYDKEKAMLEELQSTPNHIRMPLRTEIWRLQQQMSAYPSLKRILGLRRGEAARLEQLQSISKDKSRRPTVFVDWFLQGPNIHMIVVSPDSPPVHRFCQTTHAEVVNWKSQFFDTPEGFRKSMRSDDNENNPLRKLDKLVQPLKELLPENAALVFSPSGVLHTIPLHALWVDGVPVIEDYPIVYAPSLTTYIQCWERAMAFDGPQLFSKAILSIYEPGEQDFSAIEQKEIYKSAEQLGKDVKGNVKVGTAVDRDALTQSLGFSSLVQFHGHCKVSNVSMLDQALVLADGDFAARDLFSLRTNALLVTLIACGSVTQSINQGDEPLGLVSAMLCAGAPSVVGTMWPIASGFGREFIKSFYGQVPDCRDGDLINWAVALQEAVKELKYDYKYRFPVYWASAVLYGSSHCKAQIDFC